ncbi:pollen-specific leucine-rich repeat extensin-like protein 3 [Iris pallida]|uniref:Pollen-specific leucine-rich repeat extensin-like protein 3 n=1 Tax=Iris pallida TaxID=29817 RepID=A0AAX6H9L2_IRIPA|nr:pollen-specific leucine-rich repeat extensin-like protein 3 [Iris pallida]
MARTVIQIRRRLKCGLGRIVVVDEHVERTGQWMLSTMLDEEADGCDHGSKPYQCMVVDGVRVCLQQGNWAAKVLVGCSRSGVEAALLSARRQRHEEAVL